MKNKRGCASAIFMLLGIIIALCGVITVIVLRWQNPDMTDTRLFIEYPCPTIAVVVGYIITSISISVGRYK
jgi:predicted membrane channel-forming protein YqfA (hemolysin III family)